MADNFQNTSSAKTNSFTKGMVKDVEDMMLPEGVWTNAINAINNSHIGNTGVIGNEQSTQECITIPYTIIGGAYISDGTWVICSGNNVDSEIGIFDDNTCTYKKVVNDKCLNFKNAHLITGVVKKNYDCTYSFYFQDGYNQDRCLNLQRVPYKIIGDSNQDPDCYVPVYSNELDCDKILLHPLVQQPCIEVTRSKGGGQLQNGSYIAFIAYSENGIKLTDYSMPSNPQSLWDHSGIGGSIDIKISNLDADFNEFELVIAQVVNNNAVAKKIGNYNITHSATGVVNISLDMILASLQTVDLTYLPLKSVVYEKSDKMFTLNNYLIRSGVTTQPEFNYQPLANKIKVEWVAVKYPANYYWQGGNNVGYMRDEVYPFFIRWVYKTGARSASYHIPGRVSTLNDKTVISTDDVVYGKNKAWQTYDTSTKYTTSGTLPDGGEIVSKGKMAYWESSERYPNDKPSIWGSLCGKPIRHHKMPSDETLPLFETVDNVQNIFILGVEFSNVTQPVDLNNKPITDIVGYEILRGSREGNKSIVAKGMFNNMIPYDIRKNNSSKKGLIQNYPYNDLGVDPFLIKTSYFDQLIVLGKDADKYNQDELALVSSTTPAKTDMFSFHSPDTTFEKPYLNGNYVKIYREYFGVVENHFTPPYKHPKHALVTDFAFTMAALVGVGLGLMNAVGQSTTSGEDAVSLLGTGVTEVGGRVSGQMNAGADTVFANLTNIKGMPGTISGIVLYAANFLYFTGQGINATLELIRKLAKKQQYALQLNSHGFYNKSTKVLNPASNTYTPSFSRQVTPSKIKYIGSGVHNFDDDYRINNLYRNKYVALELTKNIANPVTTDTSKATIERSGLSYKHTQLYNKLFHTTTSAYYGAIKVDYDNQYGQLSSIIQIPTGSCVVDVKSKKTGVIFGGDVYINRYTEKNPYMFFNTWLMGENDGTEYDYRNYINGPLPRYWANFETFDADDFGFAHIEPEQDDIDPDADNDTQASEGKGKLKKFFKKIKDWMSNSNIITPSDYHTLDRDGKSGAFVVKKGYMYLFVNGVRDFFVESELNLAYRDYGETDVEKFYDVYGSSFQDLDLMFRSDLITKPVYHKYDLSLSASKLFTNFTGWGALLQKDFDPLLYSTCFKYYPNRVIYSLQQQEGLKRDNWKNFLPLNYKDFKGKVCTIKALNASGAVILFEDAEPVNFVGVDQLQTDGGVKVSIGDAGLFAQNMQSITNSDDVMEYASCISSMSAVNTPFGLFYISQKLGKVLHYTGNIDEISRNGLKYWFLENLPSHLLSVYPNCELYDNPVVGIGCMAVYDPQYELVYFTKKDYIPLRTDLHFDSDTGIPYYICGETELEIPAKDCKNAIDMSIILDVTGSMGSSLNNLKTSIVNIVSQIDTISRGDYQISLVTVDYNVGVKNKIVTSFSQNNGLEVITELNGVVLGSGNGVPEPTDVALESVLNNDAGVWRTDAQKIIIIITDATPDGGDDNFVIGVDDVKAHTLALDALSKDIKLIAINVNQGITTPQVVSVMNDYALTSHGSYYESKSGEVSTAILGTLATLTCPPINVKIPIKCPCEFDNPECFKDASWTVSYDPKSKTWVSFHDWKPQYVIPSFKHFVTVSGNKFWRHNTRWDNFCNFYGIDYPWEVEFVSSTPNQINTIRSVEYYMEAYKYFDDGQNAFQLLDENFDEAVIYNSEQNSGLLKLDTQVKGNPLALIQYPQITPSFIKILFSKEENKYRFNQFWDTIKDRGEFSGAQLPMWQSDPSGYRKILNQFAINYQKGILERKQFRHAVNKIILRKRISGSSKMIFKLINTKLQNSSR